MPDAKRWAEYFSDAPENLKNITEVKNLNNYIETLEIFCSGGLVEEIDNKELELESEPKEFSAYYKN